MALPANWGTGTVHCKYIKMDGSVDSGTVDFTPNSTRMTNASDLAVISGTTLSGTIDGSGILSIVLPSTNDADTNPLGFTYTVKENLASGLGRSYPILVPQGVTTELYSAVVLDPATGLYVPGTPAPSVEIFNAVATADSSAITIDTLNLDAISGLNGVVPNYTVPVCLEANIALAHTVANANLGAGIALTSATIVTGLKHGAFQQLGVIGSKCTCKPFVRLPAASPGTYGVFIFGDAGNATMKAQTYYPCNLRAWTT